MSRNRLTFITIGILLSLFLASMEGTVVSTAMPTIVAQLGGLSIYSWVFAVYSLTSTTTVPIYGKLSDLYGRKRIFGISIVLFLIGSILCATANSMEQLILYRAVQGMGAGGVLTLAFTIVGEIFTLEQRARMQGLFSGVWGVSAVIGPLIGGFLVDQVSWHWVFWINVLPSLLALGFVWFAWQDLARKGQAKVSVDYPGAALLTLGIISLLLGLEELGAPLSWVWIALALGLFGGLVWVERRAADPILPLHLFRDRLFTVSIIHGVFAGWAVFGSINYVPLFVQSVLQTSATQAGITLTPMSLFWTLASILGTPLLLKVGYRTLALVGMVILSVGAFFLMGIGVETRQVSLMVYLALLGIGMGLSVPAFLIAVQSEVPRSDLGVATSTVQFSRSIGGTLGVSVLGALLSTGLTQRLLAAGLDPNSISLDALLDTVSGTAAGLEAPVRSALAGSIAGLFIAAFVAAFLGLIVVWFAPRGKIKRSVETEPVEPDIEREA